MYGIVTSLALILVAGWFFTQFMGNVAREQVRKDIVSKAKLIIQRLTFELEEAEAAVKAMSGSPWISPALWSRSPQSLAQANSVLDRYQARFEASPAYLLDQTGTCITSSNRDAPDSFVGQNYAFRPYFKQAMAGEPGRYFALGVTSKKRGFFAAYPVRDPVRKIVGVAAIKTTLDKFQQELRDSATAFLISPDGVIFLSSRPSLDYHSLWPINRPNKDDLKAQYGTADFKAVFPRPPEDGTTVKIDGESYLFYQQAVNSFATAGWSLALLAPVNLLVFYRFLGIATAYIAVVLTLVSIGSNLFIREGANRILASEARFRAMFVAAPEAVFVYNPETGKIIDANPFMTQWLGYEPEELVGLEIDKVQAPESLGPQEELASGGSEGPHLSPGPRYRKRDGSLVEVECTAAKILHGDHIRELVFVRDITKRKRTDAELKESLSLSKATLESTADGLLVVNRQGRIVSVNQKFRELWRIPEGITTPGDAEQALNYVLDQLLDPEDFLQKVKTLYAQPAAKSFDVLHFKDGRVFECYSIPQYLDWEIVGRVWSYRDVTERIKAAEKLRQANEQLQIMVNESEWRTREATLITNMSEFLQSCLNFDEAYAIIAHSAQQLFAAVSGGLFMLDPAGNFLEMVTSWGETLAGEQVFAPNNCWAIRRGRIYFSGGSVQNEHCRHLPDKAGGSYFCLPLIAQEGAFGLLHLQAPCEGDSSVIDHIKGIAVTLTDNISMALANLKLRETLRQQVIHDPLTGLFNRRYLEETLKQEIHRSRRKRSTVGFIMMDLDHFKPFNDTYGHEAGDQLLRALGKFLKTQVREEDIACRYGGDEFVLIIPEASLDVTQRRAEEIRREVPHLQVVSQGRPLENSTISLGVAIFPDHGATVEDVLRAADDALYKAKAAGCNRVVAASDLKPMKIIKPLQLNRA
jgi:diguanylate cyclase (GGDEF)-like protein/PAS domain S-box-containing protein